MCFYPRPQLSSTTALTVQEERYGNDQNNQSNWTDAPPSTHPPVDSATAA